MSTLPFDQPDSVEVRPIANPLHTLALLAILATLAIRGIFNANQMRAAASSNVPLYLRTIATEWLLFALVLVGVRLAGTPLATVLGPRWRSAGDMLRTVCVGVGFVIVQQFVLSVIIHFLPNSGGDHAVQFLLPRGPLEMMLWLALSVSAGICEETIYRGYLQRQFAAFTRSVPTAILLSAAMFAIGHSYQGLWRAVVIGIDGATLGVLAQWYGSVRPGMVGHAFKDAVAPLLMGGTRH
jgi:membrane protease YdiL (CAAX protease family)